MTRQVRLLSVMGALASTLALAGCRPPSRLLRVVQSSDILTLDPNQKFEFVTDTLAKNLFGTLVEFDGHMTIVPALASSWDNPDERTWRFHLRPGVKFHDGGTLSAADVVYTLERVLHDPNSEIFPFLAGVKSVREIDPLSVEIDTEQPSALLPRLSYIYILPRRAIEAAGEKAFFAHPVGTGPYRFLSWKRGEELSLEAFADYYRGGPSIGRVDFAVVSEPPDQWRLIESTAPTILLVAPIEQWDQHRKDRNLRLIARPSLIVTYLEILVKQSPDNPLADRRVREALRLTLDPAKIIARAADGHGYPATQYVPPEVVGYNPELTVPSPDPGRARVLLAEAGHPAGLDLTLDYEVGSSDRILTEIVAEAARGNFRLALRAWSKDDLYERLDREQSALSVSGWSCSTGESAELFESSLHTREPNRGLGRDNEMGYSNRELDRIIEQMLSTVDAGERQSLEKRAMAAAIEDLPMIPLYVHEDRCAMTRDVRWEPRADGEINLAEVRVR